MREEYLSGNEETKRLLEKRYGKRAIKQALEETYSAEWLEKNAKACPYCGTQIQVRPVVLDLYPVWYLICRVEGISSESSFISLDDPIGQGTDHLIFNLIPGEKCQDLSLL